MPGAGLERATARSSAECSPRLSYPGISAIQIVTNLSLSFQNINGINKMIEDFFQKVGVKKYSKTGLERKTWN